MKKRIIALIVVLCVLGVSVLAMMLWGGRKGGDESSPSPSVTPDDRDEIFNFNKDEAKKLTIQVPDKEAVVIGHSVKYEKSGDKDKEKNKTDIWTYLPDDSVELDHDECNTLFSIMATLKGKKLDPEDIKDASLAEFGLDKPTVVTVLMDDDKTEYVLHVGGFAVGTSGTYVRLPDKDDIYLITEGAGYYLTSELKDFVKKDLFTLKEGDVFEKIKVVENGKTRYIIESYLPDGNDDDKSDDNKNDTYEWRAIEPVKWNLGLGDAKVFVDSFSSIRASDVVDEAKNLEKYGLDKPRYEVILTLKGKDYKLVLGDIDPTGQFYYGLWNNNKFVYSFSVTSLTELDKPLSKLIYQMIYGPSYSELSKLEIWFENKNYVFEIKQAVENDKSKDVIVYNGKSIKDTEYPEVTAAFRNVYKGALALWADDIDAEAKPSGEPSVKIVFTNRKKNETVVLEYIKKNNVHFYIMKNGQYTGLVTNIRNLDRSLDDVVPGLRATLKNFEEKFQSVK